MNKAGLLENLVCMTVTEILKALEPYTGKFPLEAMREAVAQRELVTPELLRELERVAAAPAEYAARKDNMLPLFAIYLLAQFREKSAYLPLVRILSAPEEVVEALFGDTIAEALPQILASLYDGNLAPLQELVQNEEAYEFVRGAALEALLVLEHTGRISRQCVLEYLRSLFHGRLQRVDSHAWNTLVCAVTELRAPELLSEMRQAYEEGLADPFFVSLEELEQDLGSPPKDDPRRELITDAIAEMEWWSAFNPDDAVPEQQLVEEPQPEPAGVLAPAADYSPPEPYVRGPKIGRNEPCPCGSGKKYKKCCGK